MYCRKQTHCLLKDTYRAGVVKFNTGFCMEILQPQKKQGKKYTNYPKKYLKPLRLYQNLKIAPKSSKIKLIILHFLKKV
jgi:hypothetical protein